MEMYVQEFGLKQSGSIVFIHGGGLSGWMWERQIENFRDFHCLVPDLPGQGKSKDINPFSIKDSALKIAALIKNRADSGKAHVVGHSIGAQIVVQLLSSSPEVLESAVVSSALVRRIPGISGLIKPIVKISIPLTRVEWFARLQARAFGIPEKYFTDYFADTKSITAGTLEQILVENTNYGLSKELRLCSVPTLILAGQKEIKIMRNSAKDLATALPNSKGYLVQGVGHSFIFKDPQLFNKILRAWLTNKELPTDRLRGL